MPFLLNLNNDALRAVLARTSAEDHLNLRLTCQRFNDVMNTREFRQERSELGTSEVSVKILTPFELYKEQCGRQDDGAFFVITLTTLVQEILLWPSRQCWPYLRRRKAGR